MEEINLNRGRRLRVWPGMGAEKGDWGKRGGLAVRNLGPKSAIREREEVGRGKKRKKDSETLFQEGTKTLLLLKRLDDGEKRDNWTEK